MRVMSEPDSQAERPSAAADTSNLTQSGHAGRSNAKPARGALFLIQELLAGGSSSNKRKVQSQGVDASSPATREHNISPIDPGGNGVSLEGTYSQELEDSPESETMGKSPQESNYRRRFPRGGPRRPQSCHQPREHDRRRNHPGREHGNRPPRENDNRPPPENDNRPPPENDNRPPPENDNRPAPENDNRPPPENGNRPPREHNSRPPREHGNRPPREHDGSRHALMETVQKLRSELQVAESEHEESKSQIAKLSQIVQDLGKQGLPYPREDGYFSQELNHLWRDIGQFSRLASKDQEPIAANLPEILGRDIYDIVNAAFSDLPQLLSGKPPRTLRTKCMEVIIVEELEQMIFGSKIIGVRTRVNDHINPLLDLIEAEKTTTARDVHLWHALSIHLFTKDREAFDARLAPKIEKATAKLQAKLTPLGAPGKLDSWSTLQSIVSKAAKLTQEIAILPFVIQQLDISPGAVFNPRTMEDDGLEDEDMRPEELELMKIPVDVVFSRPVIKFAWDADGEKVGDINNPNVSVISKGRVQCKRIY